VIKILTDEMQITLDDIMYEIKELKLRLNYFKMSWDANGKEDCTQFLIIQISIQNGMKLPKEMNKLIHFISDNLKTEVNRRGDQIMLYLYEQPLVANRIKKKQTKMDVAIESFLKDGSE